MGYIFNKFCMLVNENAYSIDIIRYSIDIKQKSTLFTSKLRRSFGIQQRSREKRDIMVILPLLSHACISTHNGVMTKQENRTSEPEVLVDSNWKATLFTLYWGVINWTAS